MHKAGWIGCGVLVLLLPIGMAQADDTDDRIEALERRIEAMERRHQEEMRALREELDAVMQDADAQAAPVQAVPAQAVPTAVSAFNPAVTVFGNFTGRFDDARVENEDGDAVDDRFNLREVEVDFRASIDPWADGVVIVALESESPGEFEVGVEEGYATLKKLPILDSAPLGLRLTAGRFRPDFGRFNKIHTHDLPQTTRPRSLQTFLGEEGYIESGLNAEVFIPTPGENNSLSASFALLNGGSIAVAQDNDGEDPAYLGHLEWFWDLAEGHDLELGTSAYFGRADAEGDLDARLYGVDLTYKWNPFRRGQWRSFLLGAELYAADVDETGGGNATPLGYYAWSQYQLTRNTYFGLRYDYTEQVEDDDAETDTYGAFLTYYTTEFLRLRLGYEHTESDLAELDGLDTGWLELNFVFGSHPVEPYWVNR